jgi:hypothetical protein
VARRDIAAYLVFVNRVFGTDQTNRATIGDAAAAVLRLVSRDLDRGTAVPNLRAAE